MYVAPPSSEYWNFATATSSVADRFSVCGTEMRQLLLPFGGAANAAGVTTGATVSAASAGETTASSDADPVATATSAFGQGRRTKSLIDFPLLASLTNGPSAGLT